MAPTTRTATVAQQNEQAKRLEQKTVQDSIERSGRLTERLTQYAMSYCKEQNFTPQELVFAAALYVVNLRETYPDGKPAFDDIAAKAAEYFDKNA